MKLTSKTVPISALRMSKYNWKRRVTEEDIDDLAENIEEVGNLHPIIVRPMGKAGSMYEVLAGRRRLEAQKTLGSKKVDVRVVKCDDLRAEIISYSENLKVRRPDSVEWQEGAKRLVDLFEQLYKVGVQKKPKSRVKSNGSDGSELSVPEPKNTPPGRPRNMRSKAFEDVAKSVGTSEWSVRKAVRREEDLIPSGKLALKKGSITQRQADLLATMSKTEQQQQLMSMVKETREETSQRIKVEKLQNLEDKTPMLKEMLGNVFYECNELQEKLNVVIELVRAEKRMDCSTFLKLPYFHQVEGTRDSLTDLLELLEG